MILRLSCKLRVSFVCHLCKGYVYDHVYSKTLSAPLTETMRDHTFKVEFVPAEEYEAMRDRYNSSFHSDMLHTGQCGYDGVDTWLEAARSFMKQSPWGQVKLSGGCLEEVKELGNLAQVDASRVSRAVKNSLYLPSLIESIDICIAQHGDGDKENGLWTCRCTSGIKYVFSYFQSNKILSYQKLREKNTAESILQCTQHFGKVMSQIFVSTAGTDYYSSKLQNARPFFFRVCASV